MKLQSLLSERRNPILKKWFDIILETYPAETSGFLKSQKDRFANPVGYTLSNGLEDIFDELARGAGIEKISPLLDDIIRVRAVQDVPPSKAVSFIFLLKKIVREEAKSTAHGCDLEELHDLEARVDEMALAAFDKYMQSREKIYELKANELRRMTSKLVERANLIFEAKNKGTNNGENILF